MTESTHIVLYIHADTQAKVNYLVTLKKDGTLWLDDRQINKSDLLKEAAAACRINPQFVVVIRADQGLDYGQVVALLDELKGAGITHFGLAAEGSNEQ